MSKGLALKKLGADISRTLFRQGIGIFIGLMLSILLARVLNPTGYGQYAMAILIPSMLGTFLNLGIAPANVYFIASQKITPLSALKSSLQIWLVLSVIGISAGILTFSTYGDVWFPGIPMSLLCPGVFAFPLILLQSFLISFFLGLQDFKSYNYASLIAPFTTLLLATILVWVIKQGVLGAVIAFIGGQLIGLLVIIIILRQTLNKNKSIDDDHISNSYTLQCLKYGFKSHLSNIMAFVNYKADIFCVNFFLTPASTGVYLVAVMIAEKLWILSQVVSIVILPRLSELHNEEDKRQVLTPLIARWVLFVSLIGALVMIFVGSPLISILYGSDYAPVYSIIVWLLPGILIGSMSRVLSNDIAARGKPEFNFYAALLVVIINVMLNIILIPRMGITGAAIATTIAYTLNGVVKLWIYSHLSKNPWWKSIVLNSNDILLFKEGFKHTKKTMLGYLK